MTIFIVSDTHFGHKNIINFGAARIQFKELNHAWEAMVEAWNSVVTKRDVVIHLGDAAWNVESFKWFDKCNGAKKLILGNHDKFNIGIYAKHFTSVHGSLRKGDILFTHIPVIFDKHHSWKYNVHGHLHHIEENLSDPRYYNANMDVIGLFPKALDEIKLELKLRKQNDWFSNTDK